jgi:hypothetical protein
VYWKPVFYVLEDTFTCLLVNPAHIKQVPGRKSDVRGWAWIAQLLEHGLLRGSFVPVPIRELRDLTRSRKARSRIEPALRTASTKCWRTWLARRPDAARVHHSTSGNKGGRRTSPILVEN